MRASLLATVAGCKQASVDPCFGCSFGLHLDLTEQLVHVTTRSRRRARYGELSEVAPSDTNVKEVVRTMLRCKMISRHLRRVGRPNMAYRDAVTFAVAAAGLCQSSAVRPQH